MSRRRLVGVAAGVVALAVVMVGVRIVDASNPGPRKPAERSADVGFLRDMTDHHEQAVRMSLLVVGADGVSPAVRDLAVGIVSSQRHDIGRMEAWLDDWGHGRGSPTRRAMTWMGHEPVAPAAMPGMASREQLDELARSTGAAADLRFIDLMVAHHEAGAEMADHAVETASEAKVVRLAELITAGQREEIRELEMLRAQLVAAGRSSS